MDKLIHTLQKLKKLWLDGSTNQKDGKFPHKVAVKIDEWIFGCGKELRDVINWEGEPLKKEWKEQIKGQKKLAREMLGR